ncbi:toll-like receptor 2 [Diorhabda carinulata]|uniref:toll-like receptor 2 n=1 Tax=Diorhabda carinulata TaxID=1163345 RepID=UPI0025A155F9|nr:toll-like receptor 2 [Diorhabda carinulata]
MPYKRIVAIILLPLFVKNSANFNPDDDYYDPPKYNEDVFRPVPLFLGEDVSGCVCREIPNILTLCFGVTMCNSLPIGLNITTPILSIVSTNISVIRRGDLANLYFLQDLKIEGNYNLTEISGGVFGNNFTKLENLSISYNKNLKYLNKNTFNGLVNLKQLFLIKNGFTRLYEITVNLSPVILPRLKKLSLNENNLTKIFKDDFIFMKDSLLEEFNIISCSLDYIHPKAFLPLKKLRTLRMGENFFNVTVITEVLEEIVDVNIPLKLLNLYSAGFRVNLPKKLLEIIAISNITHLNLAKNQFHSIPSGVFPLMPNLKSLDLREAFIYDISDNALDNLTNLEYLILSANNLPSIPKGVLLKNLIKLDIQENSQNGARASYFQISKGSFLEMKNLEYLNMGYNNIPHLFQYTFKGLNNLKYLILKNCTLYRLQNKTFENMNKLKLLDLENNFFITNNYPTGLTSEMFEGLENLEVLLLGGNAMTYFSKFGNPFINLKSLKKLGLDRNLLVTVESNQFSALKQLEIVDFSFNLLKIWQNRIFDSNPKLKILLFDHNKLTHLTPGMLEDFHNLTKLSLAYNSFICDCRSFKLYNNFINIYRNEKIIKILKNSEANCLTPYTTTNHVITNIIDYFEYVENDIIHCDINKRLIVVLPLLLLIICFLSLIILVFYYRWHIKYWLFLIRLQISRNGKIKSKSNDKLNYEYDAFVSYSNEDRNFVVRLVSMLENYEPFLKLCVYERDFHVGHFISECVLKCIANSRKTILIVSDNYAKSQWCRWESQIAEHHRLFFENEDGEYVADALIVIKLGPVSKVHMTPMLRYLLKTRIYLQWEADEKKQKIFWNKLRNTLSPPKNDNVAEITHM